MPDDIHMQAGEYVLGTLSAGERQAFERRLARDASLAAAVGDWQQSLAPLDSARANVAPPPALWNSIEAALPQPSAHQKFEVIEGGAAGKLKTSVARWRRVAIGTSALAAMLAIGIVTREVSRLPPSAEPNYVAVVNRGGDQPALIVRVDLSTGTVNVRPVATETPPQKSLELWYINAGATPKSMGIIGKEPLKLVVPVTLGSTFAVTVEPVGGSPSGAPTGAVVYSGKLFKE